VFELFKPLARRDWISWGGELLFGDLREEVAKEEAEEEVRRAREVEDGIREAAAATKAARIEEQWAALAKSRSLVLVQFRAKVLSKEDLQRRNAEFAEEARAIEREEAEEGVEDEDLPMVHLGKWKAVALEAEEEEVDELAEEGAVLKRAKTSSDELLDVEGPVSNRFCSRSLILLTVSFVVR